MQNISTKKGFTLIELLVVIAIIGMLSSIVFASLNTARIKGRIAQMQGGMRSAQTGALLCMDDGTSLNTPADGSFVCGSAGSKYPTRPTPGSWTYASTNDTTTSDGNFSFSATGDGKTITCTQGGC